MPRKKDPSERKVAMIFNLPPQVRNALFRKVKSGNRSKFVTKLLAEKLGVETEEKIIPQKKKSVFGKLFRK
ncbi:hypothetical protein KAI54_02785 [Candidatus Gracilibacteria bacterium]|nr:hypothetical protein [Candidatus Gracilibacteria bacterium]